MSLKLQIDADLKTAMRARDTDKLGTLRLLTAAIKQKEIDERITLDDVQVITIIDKMIKQRRDSITQFTLGGREDLAQKEEQELVVLQTFLPQALTQVEIEGIISEAITVIAPQAPSDLSKLMSYIKPRCAGRADMGQVSSSVKNALNSFLSNR